MIPSKKAAGVLQAVFHTNLSVIHGHIHPSSKQLINLIDCRLHEVICQFFVDRKGCLLPSAVQLLLLYWSKNISIEYRQLKKEDISVQRYICPYTRLLGMILSHGLITLFTRSSMSFGAM